jgi:hypothetical protein
VSAVKQQEIARLKRLEENAKEISELMVMINDSPNPQFLKAKIEKSPYL